MDGSGWSRDDLGDARAFLEHAPVMLLRLDDSGRCTFANAAFRAFTGRNEEQELGDGWVNGVHAAHVETLRAVVTDALARHASFEHELWLRRNDDVHRRVRVRGAPLRRVDGTFSGFAVSCEELQVQTGDAGEPGSVAFFEMSLDILGVAGFDGYLQRVNPSWTRALGWTPQELMSRPSIEFVHPDDRAATLAARDGLKDGIPLRALSNRYLCKDGSVRWFEWRSVSDVERRVVYAAARDVTAEREAKMLQEHLQRQLVLADRLASVGTLAAGVAHEINNPLSYVSMNLEMLLEQLGAEGEGNAEQRAEWAQIAAESLEGTERIRKIVRGLKTLSRADEDRRAPVAIRPVLELSIDVVQNEIRHRARLVKELGDTPLVEADDARLGQVFINLLVNAAQAIGAGNAADNEIRITTSRDARGHAVIEIHDSGPGIPEQLLHRIFDPFFTTKPVGVGTGLGLSICHGIVTGMRGEISASNHPVRGAVFRVSLPPAKEGAVAVESERRLPVARPRAPADPASVLVIDDEPRVAGTIERALAGHHVTVETRGDAALARLAAGERFDVILCDVMMPEMSGAELHEALSRVQPDTARQVVFMSGGAFAPTAQEFLARVPNLRLTKPFDAATLRALVESRRRR